MSTKKARPENKRPIIGVVEAAKLLQVHPQTLRAWLRKNPTLLPGRVKTTKRFYWLRAKVEAHLGIEQKSTA